MFYGYNWLGFDFIFFKMIVVLVIVFLVFLPVHFNAFAGDVDELIVTEEDGIYQIAVSAQIDASEKFVRQVITDYAHAYRINRSIIEAEVLESPIAGNLRVRARILACTPLICLELERVDEVSTLSSGNILAEIVPEKSDFHSGKALWKIIPDGDKTRLIYQASIEPGFFIPPVVGTRMAIDSMRKQLTATFVRIEQVARINQEREWDDDYGVNVAGRAENLPCKVRVDAASQ